jgi:hypothetical protein
VGHTARKIDFFTDRALPCRKRGADIGEEGEIMIDPDGRHGRELKAAEEFFALARITPSPFMRSYYQRVAERYLSSQGELRAVGPNGDQRRFPGP